MHAITVDPIVTNLTIFVLVVFVGYHVVWNVTPALHTPLMSVTNAISSVILVGAILAAGSGRMDTGAWLGAAAVALASVNTFGGFLVTERMLEMFKKKEPKEKESVTAVFSSNQVALLYLVASILFILALKGLSHPLTARKGNRFGIAGMAIAVFVTLAITSRVDLALGAIVVGGLLGWGVAKRVEMTQMPELVAAMHSLVGLAAVLIAGAVVYNPTAFSIGDPIPAGNRVELFIGTFVGAMTFSGSIIAFGKLAGLGKSFRLFSSAPIVFTGQQLVNLLIAIVMIGLGLAFVFAAPDGQMLPFLAMTAIAFVLGVLIIIPIGGADMPVVISMLNSYSGWAASGIGFSLNNPLLIVAGALVGSSGAILSYIMCKAMNRSFISVILGGFGAAEGAAAGAAEQKSVRSGSPEDVAFLLGNAESVIIVPGYGLAVARAQHAVKEMAEKLRGKGVTVRYAIHPVAGRMPGHMNVLLAEAEVPYDQVLEMEDINSDFGTSDIAFVLGANDVVNPLAEEKGSPIYGMPILEAHKARTVVVNKRSMASGYAGIDNPLFYMDKTMMVFGDAKKVVEDIVKAID